MIPAELTPYLAQIVIAIIVLLLAVALKHITEASDRVRDIWRALKRNDRAAIREIITGLIMAAEAKYPGPQTGQDKFEYVYAESIKELQRRGVPLERESLDPLIHKYLGELKGLFDKTFMDF